LPYLAYEAEQARSAAVFAAGEKNEIASVSATVHNTNHSFVYRPRLLCRCERHFAPSLTTAKKSTWPYQTKYVYANQRKTPGASIMQNASFFDSQRQSDD
jgi:hypothetical protein